MSNIKYKIVFLRKINDYLVFERAIKLKKDKTSIEFRGKRYIINKNNPSYVDKNVFVFFLDIDSGNLYQFDEIKQNINPELIDLMLGKNIIKQLAVGLKKDLEKLPVAQIIMYIALGFLIGSLIFMYYYTSKIQDIILQCKNNSTDPIIIKSLIMLVRCIK